jgi:competence protein ComEC
VTAPLVPLALAFGAGVWLGLEVAPPGWVLVAALGLAGVAALSIRRGALGAASASLLVLVALAGWARLALPDPWPPLEGLRGGPTRLAGLVTGDPEPEGPRTRVPLLLESAADAAGGRAARGQLMLLLYGPAPPLAALDRIAVTVELAEARPLRNPGSEPGLGHDRSGPRFIAVGRSASVERLTPGGVPWWLAVRAWVHRLVQRNLPPVSGALFEGLLIGERRQLPPTLVGDFRAAGVFHILAISGFNVGLVAGAALVALRVLRVPARLAAAVALATLLGFAAVVGGQASVLRATVMAGLVLAGQLLGRESGAWNSLAAALLVLLAWEPGSLGDVGLQLSFAATAGILGLGSPIRRSLPARWPAPVATAVAVSAGAQLAVTPLMLLYWNQLSLIGVVANLLVVPLAAALTTLGLLAVALAAAWEGLAHLLFQSLWALLLGLRLVVRGFAALPGAMIHAPTPPAVTLVAAASALLLVPRASTLCRRLCVARLAGLAVVATAAGFLPDGRLHVLMLDVGQGDAILIQGPDGRAILVDTGGGGPGRSDRGERVVLPALRRLGVGRLTALVLTHGDPDHAGGLRSLLDGLPIDAVWVPAGTEDAAWQRPIVESGVPRRVLARGDRLWVGPLLVTALHPPGPADGHWSSDENNASLVLRVEWGLAAVLLTGDAEAVAERSLLVDGLPLGAPILKVGHHGSRFASSPAFLAAVAPRAALISVGARNPFGHPSPGALARLADAGAALYRTDTDGAVEVTSDADRLTLRRWARPAQVEEVLLRGAP